MSSFYAPVFTVRILHDRIHPRASVEPRLTHRLSYHQNQARSLSYHWRLTQTGWINFGPHQTGSQAFRRSFPPRLVPRASRRTQAPRWVCLRSRCLRSRRPTAAGVYSPASSVATPRTSKGPSSFFRLHVRLVAAGVPAKGTVIHPPAPSARWALIPENVTCSAAASSNGVSVIMTLRLPDCDDGLVGDPLHARPAIENPKATVRAVTVVVRMRFYSSRKPSKQDLDHLTERTNRCRLKQLRRLAEPWRQRLPPRHRVVSSGSDV